MPPIVMYTRPECPYCERAKRLLAEKGQTWAEIDIGAEPGRQAEMIERSGRTSVPQIWIGDRHVGGFDDLADLERRGELDGLLGGPRGEKGAQRARVLIAGSGPAGYTAAIYTGHRGRWQSAVRTDTVLACENPATLDFVACRDVIAPISSHSALLDPTLDNVTWQQLFGCVDGGVGIIDPGAFRIIDYTF